MSRWAPIFIVLFCAITVGASDTESDLLREGIQTYQSALESTDRDLRVERFRQAEAIFDRIIQRQIASGSGGRIDASLYANLGNAALGAEHLGPAIAAYHRALAIDPSHQLATQNLDFARTLLPEWVPTPEETVALGSFFGTFKRLRPAQWYSLASVLFLLAMVLYAFFQRTGQSAFRLLAVLCGICWIGCFISPTLRSLSPLPNKGVVVIPDAIARSADSPNAPARFAQPLPSGTEFIVQETRDDWIRFELFDGRTGWLPDSAVDVIIASS